MGWAPGPSVDTIFGNENITVLVLYYIVDYRLGYIVGFTLTVVNEFRRFLSQVSKFSKWRRNDVEKKVLYENCFNVIISTCFQLDLNLISISFQAWCRYHAVIMSFFHGKTTLKIRHRCDVIILRLADVATWFQPNINVETTLCAHWGAPVADPVAETGFSHRLPTYKIVGHLLRLLYIGKYRGVIRSKKLFSESVTFYFHARMLSSQVAQD